MRAYNIQKELMYDQTRLLIFQMISGNVKIKKHKKPKRIHEVFNLPTIDGFNKRSQATEPTQITKKSAELFEVKGYKIIKGLIKDE